MVEQTVHVLLASFRLAEFWRWTIALMIGVAMGILGFLVDWGIEHLNTFKYKTSIAAIQSSGKLCSVHLDGAIQASLLHIICQT